LQLAQHKINELEQTLTEKTKERDSLNARFNTLKKEHDALTKEEQRISREFEALSAQNFNSGQKINDLKSKLETEKNDAEELKAFYEEQLAYVTKSKEYSDNEIEELKWSLDKA
jgi:septal ring factor EnvC (AmiA/AmiB activator)